jgi:hypothetical protein
MANPVVITRSRSWTVITDLATQLGTITRANGYLTDIGLNVWTTDHQRPSDDALGLMIYSGEITGPGIDHERPRKPVRDIHLIVEADIGTELDDAQERIHSVVEDVEVCMEAYARDKTLNPATQATPLHVEQITVLDRPEGAAVVVMQAHIKGRYFR